MAEKKIQQSKDKKSKSEQKDQKPKESKQSMDLFKHPTSKASSSVSPKLTMNINEILRRLRILEERYSNIRKKTQLSEQNMLEDTKNISEDIQVINMNLKELKKDLSEVNSKMKLLSEEIESSAQKRDINLLTKYVDFWQPMNFLSKEEATKMIEDTLNEIKLGRKKI